MLPTTVAKGCSVGGSVGLIQHNTIVLNTNGESASDCLNIKTILFDLVDLLSGCLISVLKRVNRLNITTRIQEYASLLFHVIKTIRLAYTCLEIIAYGNKDYYSVQSVLHFHFLLGPTFALHNLLCITDIS